MMSANLFLSRNPIFWQYWLLTMAKRAAGVHVGDAHGKPPMFDADTPRSHWCDDGKHDKCAGYFYRAAGPQEDCECRCHVTGGAGHEYEKALRHIRRRDWFANNVPVFGPLAFRFWLWRSRG